MEGWLLAALVALASAAGFGLALLGAWRQVRALVSDVGRAGGRVGAISGDLGDALAQLQSGAAVKPPSTPSSWSPRSSGGHGAAPTARGRASR